MRRVLIVSFFYPPDPAVGGRRVAKFAGYLPEFGWSPTVLTARTTEGPSPVEAAHPPEAHATLWFSPWSVAASGPGAGAPGSGPLRERAAGTAPGRAAYLALRHILPMSTVRMPDATFGWVPYALDEGRRILAAGRFDAILSSCGPPSSHIVASRLQAGTGLPWVADYRDLWSGNHWDRRIAPFDWLERRLERRVLRGADRLTAVAPALVDRLAELHGRPADVVYNGFDPADYPEAPDASRDGRTRGGFLLTYVGSLYTPGQDPDPLFRAVARLEAGRADQLDRVGFVIEFLGTPARAVEGRARAHGIGHRIRIRPPVPHRDCLARQRGSTALLFLGWRDPDAGVLTTTLFEYLGAGRPILAVGPPGGVASDLLTGCGAHDLTADPDALARRLADWLDEFERTGDLAAERDEDAVRRYTRREQTRRLAEVMHAAAIRG